MNKPLHILIVEDDIISQEILHDYLGPYGKCDVVENGKLAVHSFANAWKQENPYHLICMDIIMPEVDGQQALKAIRQIEKRMHIPEYQRAKVIMTSSLKDNNSILEALYDGEASRYLIKPIEYDKLIDTLKELQLISEKISLENEK